MRTSRTSMAGILLAISILVPAAARAVTLDAFTDALPPNPCLPVTAAPVVFWGDYYCDGTTCPPDPWAVCVQEVTIQSGLAGVLYGVPRTLRVLSGELSRVDARVRPELEALAVTSTGPNNHLVVMAYGSSSGNSAESINLDLVALGVTAFRIPLSLEVSPGAPMDVVVQLWGGAGTSGPPNADATVIITASGDVVVPLAAFTTRFGFSFADVWGIDIAVVDCNDEGCPDEPYPARDYRIGPITTDGGGPTVARSSSWGTLKTIYR